jgi:hypothetical protein
MSKGQCYYMLRSAAPKLRTALAICSMFHRAIVRGALESAIAAHQLSFGTRQYK